MLRFCCSGLARRPETSALDDWTPENGNESATVTCLQSQFTAVRPLKGGKEGGRICGVRMCERERERERDNKDGKELDGNDGESRRQRV